MSTVNSRRNPPYKEGVISILCPTRQRPNQLITMINSSISRASKPNLLEFCLYIDKDDTTYDQINFSTYGINIRIFRGNKMWLSGMYNCLASVAQGEFFFWSGDDVEFLTDNWDQHIRDSFTRFEDKLIVTHVNDMAITYPQVYATIGAVHFEWVQTFGYIFTPHLRDNGIDFWISDVAKQVDRLIYLPQVQIEHRQYRQKKGDFDETYLRRLQDHELYNPSNLYRKLRSERRLDALLIQSKGISIKISESRHFLLSKFWIRLLQTYFRKKVTARKEIYILSMDNKTFLIQVLRHFLPTKRRIKWD